MPTIETPVANAAATSAAAAAIEDRGTISVKKPSAGALRARELMRKPIAPAIFFGTILLLLAAIGIAAGLILQQRTAVPAVDVTRERLVAQQRALRIHAAELLATGQADRAYETYLQLRQTAPNSPAVNKAIAEIEFERFKVMSRQQRLNEATAKLNEGRRLYEQRKYPAAITLFEEAFHLDPESETAVNYLRMTREQLALNEVRERPSRRAAAVPPRAAEPPPPDPAATAASTAPAALVTVLNSPVADGTLLVKVDGQTILNEVLYEERRGILKRRTPRQINVYREIRAREVDVQLWVLIPSLRITEHRKLTMKLEPGKVHRLVITVDAAAKKVDVSG